MDEAMYSHLDREDLLSFIKKSQDRVGALVEDQRQLRNTVDSLKKRVDESEPVAMHFNIMIRAVHENAIVRDAWEKFMMTLRMTGYDKSE